MKSIDYLISKSNCEGEIQQLLGDWDIPEELLIKLNLEQITNLIFSIDSLVKNAYEKEAQVEINSPVGGKYNLDLFVDACCMPNDIMYEAMRFNNSVSLTISFNELKAFALELVLEIIALEIFDEKTCFLFAARIVAFLVQKMSFISKAADRCIIKAIVNLESQSKDTTFEELSASLVNTTPSICKLNKCGKYNANQHKCNTITEEYLKSTLKKLADQDVIREKTQVQKTFYTIANIFES